MNGNGYTDHVDSDDSIDGEGPHSAPATPVANKVISYELNNNNQPPNRFLSDPEIQQQQQQHNPLVKQPTVESVKTMESPLNQCPSSVSNAADSNYNLPTGTKVNISPSIDAAAIELNYNNKSNASLSQGQIGVKLRNKSKLSPKLSSPSMRILCPRLCHIRKWSGLTYGFNLVSKKGETGHYIDNLEEGFPGFYGGLRNGDRVIEVNAINVVNQHHNEVVKLIRESSNNEIKLLVVDEETEKYFQSKGYSISSDKVKAQVKFIACPAERPISAVFSYEVASSEKEASSSQMKRHATIQEESEHSPPRHSDLIAQIEEHKKRSTLPASVKTESKIVKQLRRLSAAGTAATSKISDTLLRSTNSNILPRLCHLTEIPSKGQYGFVLRTYLDSNEQQVVKVEKNSIADRSGVQVKDLIIEINGVNISNENHVQVTNRIKNTGSQLSLLLVTPKALHWYKKQNKVPKASEAIVITTQALTSSPVTSGATAQIEKEDEEDEEEAEIVNIVSSVDSPEVKEYDNRNSKAPFLLRKPPRRSSGPVTVERVVHQSTSSKSKKQIEREEFELKDFSSCSSEWSDPNDLIESLEESTEVQEEKESVKVSQVKSNGGSNLNKKFLRERAI